MPEHPRTPEDGPCTSPPGSFYVRSKGGGMRREEGGGRREEGGGRREEGGGRREEGGGEEGGKGLLTCVLKS